MAERNSRGQMEPTQSAGSPVKKFTDELAEATKGLGGFAKVTEQTTRGIARGAAGAAAVGAGLVGAGFAKNTAAKIGRQTVRAAGFDLVNYLGLQVGAGGLSALGANLSGGDVAFSAARGMAQNPTLAKAFNLDLNLTPYLAAGKRTLGITSALARLGVASDQIAEVREAAFGAIVPEEKRVAKESRAVTQMARDAAGTQALSDVEAFGNSLVPEFKSMISGLMDGFFSRLSVQLGGTPSGGPGGGGGAAGAVAGMQ